jgi:hypothetical protein
MNTLEHPITAIENALPTQAAAKQGLSSIYHTSLNGIQMSFALIMALAWYSLIKHLILKVAPNESRNLWMMFIYAIIMTIVFVAISYFISKKLGINVGNPVIFAVTP